MTARRFGAYVLAGDPVWLARTLRQYYGVLEDLVIAIPRDGRGWTGAPIPVDEVRAIIADIDTRHIAREIFGTWVDPVEPIRADTAQRQAALDALGNDVDWVLQIDNDEYLPQFEALLRAIEEAESRDLTAVEWPMRVLYRRTRRAVFEVVGENREPRYDYPGPIAVRPGVRLLDARRTSGPFLRPVVQGDDSSLQLRRPAAEGEIRWAGLQVSDAIVHNSWARTARDVRRKIRTWGHARGWRDVAYYWFTWLPAPVSWRMVHDLHPFAHGLWPRLQRRSASDPDTGQ